MTLTPLGGARAGRGVRPARGTGYITFDEGEWKELPVRGSWFNEAFIGTMGGLMKKIDDPNYEYMNSVEDAFHTMCVVEACYKSSAEGGTPVDYSEK